MVYCLKFIYLNGFGQVQRETKLLRRDNFYNTRDVLCVVTDMEEPMKTFVENNTPEDLDEEEAKHIPDNNKLELALTRYMDRE